MTFEDQLNALIFFHMEEHTSAQHLLQFLEDVIAPKDEIKKNSFSEAISLKRRLISRKIRKAINQRRRHIALFVKMQGKVVADATRFKLER